MKCTLFVKSNVKASGSRIKPRVRIASFPRRRGYRAKRSGLWSDRRLSEEKMEFMENKKPSSVQIQVVEAIGILMRVPMRAGKSR